MSGCHSRALTLPHRNRSHMSHQLLAVFAMGGSAPLYDAIYKLQGPQLKPAFQAPEAITEDNYHKFLGQRQSVSTYYTSSWRVCSCRNHSGITMHI